MHRLISFNLNICAIGDMSQTYSFKKRKLYTRRWGFLIALVFIQFFVGVAFASFGQISNFYVKFYRTSHAAVDWLTLGNTAAPIITTVPFAWLAYRGLLRFRGMALFSGFVMTLGFTLTALSTISRRCFPIAVLGEIAFGLATQVMLTTPLIFAVQWFPENQVGTGISVNVVGTYLGFVGGFLIPTKTLYLYFRFSNASYRDRLLDYDNYLLRIMQCCYAAICLFISIFLFIFLTDRPPTPPTYAQELKVDSIEIMKTQVSFWRQTCTILSNKTFILTIISASALYQSVVVEFMMMSQILKPFMRKDYDVMGAYVMVVFSVGSAVGTLAIGAVVNVFKRYRLLCIVGALITFVSSVGIALGAFYRSFATICVSNFVFGFFSQMVVVVACEIATQETYPIDETTVGIWFIGMIIPSAVVFGLTGRLIFKKWGGVAVLIFQCCCVLFGLVFVCFLKVSNRRLLVEEREGQTESETASLVPSR